jgi:fumarate hydratase class II
MPAEGTIEYGADEFIHPLTETGSSLPGKINPTGMNIKATVAVIVVWLLIVSHVNLNR